MARWPGDQGRRRWGFADTILPRAHQLRRLFESGHDDGNAQGCRPEIRSERTDARRRRTRRRDQALERLEPGPRMRHRLRALATRRRASTCSAPAARASKPASSSATRLRSARSRPASPAARIRSAMRRSSIRTSTYQQLLLKSFRGKSFGETGAAVAQTAAEAFQAGDARASSSRAPVCRWAHSTEITAKNWKITPRAPGPARLASHLKAAEAYDAGFYSDLVVAVSRRRRKTTTSAATRRLEKLAKLKPVLRQERHGHDDRRQQHAAHRRRRGGAACRPKSGRGRRIFPIHAYLRSARWRR